MDKNEKKFKLLNFKVKSADEEKRVITAIGSSSKVDRDKEIVSIKGLNLSNYKKNPVILWAHDHKGLPVGRANKVSKTKDGELKFDIEFASADVYPFADVVYKLYKEGFLNSFSIGFLPDFKEVEYNEKKGILTFNKSELLELSCCPVPANADSRVITRSLIDKAVKSSVIDKAEADDFEITLKELGFDLSDNTEQKTEEPSVDDEIEEIDAVIKDAETKVEETKVEVLIKRIEELEARVKELEASEDIVEEDSDSSYYDELFKSVSDEESQEEDSMDEFLDDLLEEK